MLYSTILAIKNQLEPGKMQSSLSALLDTTRGEKIMEDACGNLGEPTLSCFDNTHYFDQLCLWCTKDTKKRCDLGAAAASALRTSLSCFTPLYRSTARITGGGA